MRRIKIGTLKIVGSSKYINLVNDFEKWCRAYIHPDIDIIYSSIDIDCISKTTYYSYIVYTNHIRGILDLRRFFKFISKANARCNFKLIEKVLDRLQDSSNIPKNDIEMSECINDILCK